MLTYLELRDWFIDESPASSAGTVHIAWESESSFPLGLYTTATELVERVYPCRGHWRAIFFRRTSSNELYIVVS